MTRVEKQTGERLLSRISRLGEPRFGSDGLKAAWALALRYFQFYSVTGDEAYLRKSYDTAAGICSINAHFIWAYFLCVYIELTLSQGSAYRAQAMMDRLKPYKNVIKASPLRYGVQTFLQAAVELKKGKAKAARKLIGGLESLNNNLDDPVIDILLGGFALLVREREAALEYFLYAAERTPDNAMLMLFLHELLVREGYIDIGDKAQPLLPAFFRWGMSVGVNLEETLERRRLAVLDEAAKDPALGRALYAAYPLDWLLMGLCGQMIRDGDHSLEAYRFYKLAESRQITMEGLPEALVTAAYRNKIDSVSRYTISQYMDSQPQDDDYRVQLFVYSLLLRRDKTGDIIRSHKQDIMRLGFYALEKVMADNTGSYPFYLPGICRYMLEELWAGEQDPRYTKYLEQSEKIARETLFTYEVRIQEGKAGYVWLFEDSKVNSKIYEINSGVAIVTAAGPDFRYFLFDDAMKNIVDAAVTVTPRFPNPGDGFCLAMYHRGFQPLEMLISLARRCLNPVVRDGEKTQAGSFSALGIEILQKAAGNKEISERFRVQLSAALGGHYALKGSFDSAVACYEAADENLLTPMAVESKLLTYVNAGKLQEAAAIIARKGVVISDKALFYSVKKIAAVKKYNKAIAAAAYELTFKNWYDRQLVAIAMEHAQASLGEWQEFSKALAAVNAADESLDENIINNTIWMHRFDPGSQKVFVRLYEENPVNPYVMAFAVYAAYEMIVNGIKPEYETIDILEKIMLSAEDDDIRFLCYGLCHVYKNHNVTTFHSGEILRLGVEYCEADGFIFPALKEIKDKSLLTPYIEKNQPFVYRGGKGKRVKLHYSAATGEDFAQKTMRYVRFGLYAASVPVFYGETLRYFFSEETATGSVLVKEASVTNKNPRLVENTDDLYYIINNAIIYESMFKYEAVEDIITDSLKEGPRVKGWLM